jgi:WD40 repeat protein
MSATDRTEREEQLSEWLAACDEKLAAGSEPGELCPADAPTELRLLAERDLAFLKRVQEALRAPGSSNALGDFRPTGAASRAAVLADPTGRPPDAGAHFGRFQIRRELGRGGFGVVFLAFDPVLQRDVALKVPKADVLVSPELRARFQHEARAAACLDHPNLVPVFDAGEDGLVCYIASAYCPGITLAEWLRLRKEPVSIEEAAELVVTLADAVHHAHSRGVLHRDLKPGNVLLEAPGGREFDPEASTLAYMAKITDFGLAKIAQEGPGAYKTQSGILMGTPCYMAPEQTGGKTNQIGPATDIFALGAILYELLTGRPPFRGETVLETLHQVRAEEPISVRRLRAKVPRDLETICLTCLQKEPQRRYASAADLAGDLKRYLAGESIRARPVGQLERLGRWCQRNPPLAFAVSLAGLLVVATACLAIAYAAQQANAAHSLRLEQARTQEALKKAQRLSANLALDRGLAFCEQDETDRGLLWLVRSLELAPPEATDLKQAIRANLGVWFDALNLKLMHDLELPGLPLAATFSPDRRVAYTVSSDGTIRGRSIATGEPVGEDFQTEPGLHAAAFSADGRLLVTCSDRGGAQLWDLEQRKPIRSLLPASKVAKTAALSSDAKIAAIAIDKGAVELRDIATGELVGEALPHRKMVAGLAFSCDGKLLLTGCEDGAARLWDVETATPRGAGFPHLGPVDAVAFSPDGQTVLTVCLDAMSRFWNADTGEPIGPNLAHNARATACAFSPDGRLAVTASADRTIRLWDPSTGEPLGPPRFHTAALRTVAFSPDGQWIVAGGRDSARIWQVQKLRESILRHPAAVQTIALSGDGKTAVTACQDGIARVWDLGTSQVVPLLGHANALEAAAISLDGRTVATASWDGTARLWDAASGRQLHLLSGHKGIVKAVALSPDGKRALSASYDGTARLWDVCTGALVGSPLAHEGTIESWAIAFSPDGKLALTGSNDGTARLWDAETGQAKGVLKHPAPVHAVAFRPDGRAVLTGSTDNAARIWDITTCKLLQVFRDHQGSVRHVAFSPDGQTIATASFDGTARLWDAASGRTIGEPLRHHARVRSVAFHPDGKLVLTAGFDGTARLWDAATGKPVGPPVRHHGWVVDVRFSADGRSFFTGSCDGTVHIGAIHHPMPGDPREIACLVQMVTGMQLDQQGVIRVLDAPDWRDRMREYKRSVGPLANSDSRTH